MSNPSFVTLRQSPVGSATPAPKPNWNEPSGCSGSSSIRVTVSTRVTVTVSVRVRTTVSVRVIVTVSTLAWTAG